MFVYELFTLNYGVVMRVGFMIFYICILSMFRANSTTLRNLEIAIEDNCDQISKSIQFINNNCVYSSYKRKKEIIVSIHPIKTK